MSVLLKAYLGAILLAGAAFVALVDWHALAKLQGADYAGLAVFVLLAALSQYMGVDSGTGRRVRSSLAFLPLLALAILFPTAALVLALLIMFAANDLRGDKSWYSLAFNLSQTILAYGLAGKTFRIFGDDVRVTLGSDSLIGALDVFFPFYAAAISFFGINILLVSGYFSIRDRQSLPAVIRENAGRGGGNFFYDLLASPVALLAAYLYVKVGISGLLFVVLPLLLIRYSYLSALQLERANRDLLRVLIKAIETRDPYTSGHSMRVSKLARLIAEDYGIRPRAAAQIETAGLLHDIGKIDALYAEIIAKDGALTKTEVAIIRTHSTKGADLLQSLTSLERDIIVGVRHHHERYDGTGYPDGLSGKSIPLAARIIMICDSVDAMLSDRPYRAALPVARVRSELRAFAGAQFDPDIVRSMLQSNTLERAEFLVDRSGARSAAPRLTAIAR